MYWPTASELAVAAGPDYETRLANARLRAKAPDLRDALRWALDQIEDDLAPDHQAALAHARSLLED